MTLLRYLMQLKNGRVIDACCEEGDTSNFINKTSCTKQYTHHPIAIYQEIVGRREFRHIQPDDLYSLIKKHGVSRHIGTAHDHYLYEKLNPRETIERVAIHGGISCVTCDGMVWESGCYHEDHDFSFRQMFQAYELTPFGISGLFKSTIPVICHRCNQIAKNIRHITYEGHDIYNLSGLLAIYKKRLSEKFPVKDIREKKRARITMQ